MPPLRRLRPLVFTTIAIYIFYSLWSWHDRQGVFRLDGGEQVPPRDFYHKTLNAIDNPRPWPPPSPPPPEEEEEEEEEDDDDSMTEEDSAQQPEQPPLPPPPRGQTVLDPAEAKPDSISTEVDLDGDGDVDTDDAAIVQGMTQRLGDAEQQAKDLANQKSPLKPESPSEVVGIGNAAAEGQKQQEEKDKEVSAKNEEQPDKEGTTDDSTGSSKDREAETELGTILKKSPVIIFSKTYCPYSKKAKLLLLGKYNIEPAPHVVELDTHPLGPQLQQLLGDKTNRRTVPNIMVNGVSIGGFDSIEELDNKGELVAKVQEIGEARKVVMTLQ